MIALERLRQIVSDISLGAFRPAMTIEAVIAKGHEAEHVAVVIGIDACDVEDQNAETLRLYECHVIPDAFADRPDRDLALWIYERCQDIILHEMDEFIRFRGAALVVPVHPVTADVFEHVRERNTTAYSDPSISTSADRT